MQLARAMGFVQLAENRVWLSLAQVMLPSQFSKGRLLI